ncbi:MAG: anti-sigma factor [Planctomycetota bacterium]|jgi:hypothetical protein
MKEDSDMDKIAAAKRTDELLNSFIDGELSARQRTEVERLTAHDPRIALRLQQLQKCKTLVASLPRAEAPAGVLEGVKASLAPTALPDEAPTYNERAGRRHLLGRRLLSAAAMLGLVAVLAGVIYTIVAPETVMEGPVLVRDTHPPTGIEAMKPGPGVVSALPFSGRLELNTDALPEVDTAVNRTIGENGLSDSIGAVRQEDKRIYYLSCSREGLNLLLADLDDIWSKLDSASLFIDTEIFARQVSVDHVTTGQIAEIVHQDSHERRLEVARNFAAVNSMTELLPGKVLASAIEGDSGGLLTAPKPFITGPEPTTKPASRVKGKETIRLTIVVSW